VRLFGPIETALDLIPRSRHPDEEAVAEETRGSLRLSPHWRPNRLRHVQPGTRRDGAFA
jgi:hypothetical protein